ncbi:MAG: hypothetical protein AAGD25_20335 [Cyanobacteria bacterium P01_F01_bin.150]
MTTINDNLIQLSQLPDDVQESIAIASVNSIAAQPSELSNLSYSNALTNVNLSQQNTLANQQSVNQVGIAALGDAVNLVSDLSPMEAVAVVKMDTGNDVAQQIADLRAVLSDPRVVKPVKPIKPVKRSGPTVTLNPDGGTIIVLTNSDLPIELNVIDEGSSTPPTPGTLQKSVTISSKAFAGQYIQTSGSSQSQGYTYAKSTGNQPSLTVPYLVIPNQTKGKFYFFNIAIPIQVVSGSSTTTEVINVWYNQGLPQSGTVLGQKIDTNNVSTIDVALLLEEYFNNKSTYDDLANKFWWKVQGLPVVSAQSGGGWSITLEPQNMPAQVTYPDGSTIIQN